MNYLENLEGKWGLNKYTNLGVTSLGEACITMQDLKPPRQNENYSTHTFLEENFRFVKEKIKIWNLISN